MSASTASFASLAELFKEAAVVNPLLLNSVIVDELVARINETFPDATLADAANVPAVLMEMFSSGLAQAHNQIVRQLRALYPLRALSTSDIYRHLASRDFVQLFATPAETVFRIMFDPAYLKANALPYDPDPTDDSAPDMSLAMLPDTATFTAADMQYGIHYPVRILINQLTGAFTVSWDESVSNPLYSPPRNALEAYRTRYDGLEVMIVELPVQQFRRLDTIEEVNAVAGFYKMYTFTDRFYALRVFRQENGEWVEMERTLSPEVYDPATPTALIEVATESGKVAVTIPQIYFDNGMVGTRIKVSVYTTFGALDVSLGDSEVATVKAAMVSQDGYSAVWNRMPTLAVLPSSRKISGGSNGLTFAELKQRVVNRTLTSDTLVTDGQLAHYFGDLGYAIERYRDGVDNRVFYAYRTLTDTAGLVIGAASLPLQLTVANMALASNHIKQGIDGSYIIMPSALFRYDETTGRALPVSNADRTALDQLSVAGKVAAYNGAVYLKSPYHIKFHPADRYPIGYSYDLSNPLVNAVIFEAENPYTGTQLSVVNASMAHLEGGTGGFELTLDIAMSEDLVTAYTAGTFVPDSAAVIHLEMTNSLGDRVLITVRGTDDATTMTVSGTHLYVVTKLATSYSFTTDHEIRLTDFVDIYGNGTYDFPLAGNLSVICLVKTEQIAVGSDLANAVALSLSTVAGEIYDNTYVQLGCQTLQIVLGTLLTQVHNDVAALVSAQDYLRYASNVYATYPRNVYVRENNVPVYPLQLEHNAGDWLFPAGGPLSVIGATAVGSRTIVSVFTDDQQVPELEVGMAVAGTGIPQGALIEELATNEDTGGIDVTLNLAATATATDVSMIMGEALLLHAAGDIRLDDDQQPIVSVDRSAIYLLNAIMVDAKLAISDEARHATIATDMTDALRGYFATIDAALSKMLEGTELYFRPLKSIGTGSFLTATGATTSHDLEVTTGFRLYVPSTTANDVALQDSIRDTVAELVDAALAAGSVNCAAIAASIYNAFGDHITSIDILGIGADVSLQTLISVDTANRPNLKQTLTVRDDGTIGIERGLTIEFVEV